MLLCPSRLFQLMVFSKLKDPLIHYLSLLHNPVYPQKTITTVYALSMFAFPFNTKNTVVGRSYKCALLSLLQRSPQPSVYNFQMARVFMCTTCIRDHLHFLLMDFSYTADLILRNHVESMTQYLAPTSILLRILF